MSRGRGRTLSVRSVAPREYAVPDLPFTDWSHSTHNTHKVLAQSNPVLDSPGDNPLPLKKKKKKSNNVRKRLVRF